MKFIYLKQTFKGLFISVALLFSITKGHSISETTPTCSFIIHSELGHQIAAIALTPYGLIQDMIKNHDETIKWDVGNTKSNEEIQSAGLVQWPSHSKISSVNGNKMKLNMLLRDAI